MNQVLAVRDLAVHFDTRHGTVQAVRQLGCFAIRALRVVATMRGLTLSRWVRASLGWTRPKRIVERARKRKSPTRRTGQGL